MADDYNAGEHVKETFAHFGRAFYMASVLDTALAMALLWVDFLPRVKAEFEAKGKVGFDRPAYESAFDKFLADQHAQTTGNLHKRLFASGSFDDALKDQMREAKKRRDFIVHHYFRERAVEFSNRQGRDAMIVELSEAADLFQDAEASLDAEMTKARAKLGIDEQLFARHVARLLDEIERT